MLQMMPIRDTSRLKALNRAAGVDAHNGYLLSEGDEALGWLLYDVTDAEARLLFLSAPDDAAADGLYRSVFGSLQDIGMDKLRFDGRLDRAQLVRLGFLAEESEQEGSIRSIFARGCRSCTKKV